MFRKYIKINWKEHPILIISIVCSLILAILPCATFIIGAEYEKWSGLIFLPPAILVILTSLIANITFKKHPLLTKIFSCIINTSIIVILQIGYGLILFFILALCEAGHNYNDIDEYTKALASINHKEYIQHFPSQIPKSATNIKFIKTSNYWFGSEEITLKFKIDNNYIKNELSKYSYSYIEPPEKREYRHNNFHPDLSLNNFTLYIINDYLSKKVDNIGPYQYGIAVDSNTNEIGYYYINPD